MKVLIETPRTYLRQFTVADAEAVFALSGNSQVTRYTGDADLVNSLADAKDVIINIWLAEYKKYGYGRYAVVDKKNDKVIGFCGFKFIPTLGLADLGYRLLPAYWGQGLATELSQASKHYGLTHLKLTTFFADVMPENLASKKIIVNLGMEYVEDVHEYGYMFERYVFPSQN